MPFFEAVLSSSTVKRQSLQQYSAQVLYINVIINNIEMKAKNKFRYWSDPTKLKKFSEIEGKLVQNFA